MTWLAAKTLLSKWWIWLKEHWQLPFLFFWTILVYILTRRNTDALVEVISAKRDSYKRQLEVLRNSHNDEILKRNELDQKYEETLSNLEKRFSEKEKELSEKQKNDLKDVIIKSKGNPDEIKRRIEEEFGFRYVD